MRIAVPHVGKVPDTYQFDNNNNNNKKKRKVHLFKGELPLLRPLDLGEHLILAVGPTAREQEWALTCRQNTEKKSRI